MRADYLHAHRTKRRRFGLRVHRSEQYDPEVKSPWVVVHVDTGNSSTRLLVLGREGGQIGPFFWEKGRFRYAPVFWRWMRRDVREMFA